MDESERSSTAVQCRCRDLCFVNCCTENIYGTLTSNIMLSFFHYSIFYQVDWHIALIYIAVACKFYQVIYSENIVNVIYCISSTIFHFVKSHILRKSQFCVLFVLILWVQAVQITLKQVHETNYLLLYTIAVGITEDL